MNVIPIPVSMLLASGVAAGLWIARIRTHGTEVHEAGEGNDPWVYEVDNVATIELGDPLDI